MHTDARAAGLDEAGLTRLRDHLDQRYVQPGKLVGCQVAVGRSHTVGHYLELGLRDRERGRPVTEDTIWRIFSMTKPLTAVALMTLFERGVFQLTDPVHRWIPEFADLQVKEHTDDGAGRLVAPARPMTVLDALTHMTGFSAARLNDIAAANPGAGPGLLDSDLTLETFCARLGESHLSHHPGTRWVYGVSTDICARLVEAMSGRSFADYLRETVLEPLGMHDTGFRVGDDDVERFAANYGRANDKSVRLLDDPETSTYRTERSFHSGGGGLVSTIGDYVRFCRMLLNGGELDGARILGRSTIDLMTVNHLPGGGDLREFALPGGYGEVGFDGQGFGLTMAVGQGSERTKLIGPAGDYMWGGYASTTFWCDPVEDLFVVFMTQLIPSGTYNLRAQLRSLVYPCLL